MAIVVDKVPSSWSHLNVIAAVAVVAEGRRCFVMVVVAGVGKAFDVVEPSLPFARLGEALCCSTLKTGRAVRMDSAPSFRRMVHIQHSAAEDVFWHVHLHTSYQAIACQNHRPDPEHKLIYLIKTSNLKHTKPYYYAI